MTKQTAYLKNKIQEYNNLLKTFIFQEKCVDIFLWNFVGKYQVCATSKNPIKEWIIKDESVII